ncbi:MAG: hypothetical protein PHI23_04045 [Candidatus Peribacteraceae bacterium]|nr:hypothetical protein [Candidatus Peribacteraceae bacterium]
MHIRTFPDGEHAVPRERRLLFATPDQRHDLLEQAEQTGGSMKLAPLQELESHTQKLAKDVSTRKTGWLDWAKGILTLRRGGDVSAEKTILQAAEQKISRETDLAIGRLWGLVRRGKRRLFLAARDRVAEQMRKDLSEYLRQRQRTSLEKASRFRDLANLLRTTENPLPLTPTAREKLTLALQRVGTRFEKAIQAGTAAGTDIPQEWKDAQETENMVKQQLLRLNILAPEQLEIELEMNAKGQKNLEEIVKTAPALANEPELREWLLSSLKELRRGEASYYRAQRLLEKDVNAGDLQQKLAFLKKSPTILGRIVKLDLGGMTAARTYVAHRGEGYLVLRQGSDYYIFDTDNGELTYRDGSGNYHDRAMEASSFSLA